MKRVVSDDGDVKEIYHSDPHCSGFHIEIVQDVASHLAANKEQYLNTPTGKRWKGSMHKVASVPEVVLAKWWKELGSNPLSRENKGWLSAKLNNSEFSKLRTKGGVI